MALRPLHQAGKANTAGAERSPPVKNLTECGKLCGKPQNFPSGHITKKGLLAVLF